MARFVVRTLVAIAAWMMLSPGVSARGVRVVASINPIHSLVAGVMGGTSEPVLLVKGGASPHTYSLRTSEARTLQQADVVFWVGENLETFLKKPLEALPHHARVVALSEAEGVRLLPYRAGGPWEAHRREGDGGHDEHESGSRGAEHDHKHGHDLSAMDMHLWLDPTNAKAMVGAIVTTLSAADPERAVLYQANGEKLQARLDALDQSLRVDLAPVVDRPYIVFHDAYQYFENRYGLTPVGSITVSPERQPSAQRIHEIHEKVVRLGATCIFREPQFEPALVKTVIEGTSARTGVLDADGGVSIPPGPEAYFTLLQNLAKSLKDCLASAS